MSLYLVKIDGVQICLGKNSHCLEMGRFYHSFGLKSSCVLFAGVFRGKGKTEVNKIANSLYFFKKIIESKMVQLFRVSALNILCIDLGTHAKEYLKILRGVEI